MHHPTYYYQKSDGAVIGPVQRTDLSDLINVGRLSTTTQITPGHFEDPDWRPAAAYGYSSAAAGYAQEPDPKPAPPPVSILGLTIIGFGGFGLLIGAINAWQTGQDGNQLGMIVSYGMILLSLLIIGAGRALQHLLEIARNTRP